MKNKACHIALFILSALFSYNGLSQTISGRVTDAATGTALFGADILNKSTNILVRADANGNFNILAGTGDSLFIAFHGYAPERMKITNSAKHLDVKLKRRELSLKEVEILSDYLKYQRDSITIRETYRKQLHDATQKPKFEPTGSGIGFTGGISALARKISGKDKRDKKLLSRIEQDERSKYVSLVYNPEVVKSLTDAKDSTARNFIYHNPMPYDFARAASSLEIKMWIKHHYKLWADSTSQRTTTK